MRAMVETYIKDNYLDCFETRFVNNITRVYYDIDSKQCVVTTLYTNWHFPLEQLKRLELIED